MADGWITAVTLSGPDESNGLGAVLVDPELGLGPKIVEFNTLELDNLVDGISGASITYNGIKEACQAAIDEIIAASESE
jgi:Na+-transporting NADH:ubiquinone oxidoreductase subunit NqrC